MRWPTGVVNVEVGAHALVEKLFDLIRLGRFLRIERVEHDLRAVHDEALARVDQPRNWRALLSPG